VCECQSSRWLQGKVLVSRQVEYFKEVYNKLKPSLIHAHFLTDAACFHPLTRFFKIPKICSVYGYDVSSFPNRYWGLGKYYLRKVFREYDYFLAMSHDMAKDLIKIGCPENRITVHYHGIDALYFRWERNYSKKDTFNILTISSLHTKKGQDVLLNALNGLIKNGRYENFILDFVGGGPSEDFLKHLVVTLKLETKVRFLGEKGRDWVYDNLHSYHILVQPSRYEGFGLTIVEGLVAGLPVVASKIDGPSEILEKTEMGFLFENEDTADCAKKIGDVIDAYMNKTLISLAIKSKKIVEDEYDIFQCVSEYLTEYAHL